MSARITVGLAAISFKQAFWAFSEDDYRRRVAQLEGLGRQLGFDLLALPASFSDADGAQQAARQLNEQADFVVLDVATFPEGKAAETFFGELWRPLALWSRDESTHGTNIGHNSFCGANFLAGNLALKHRRFRKLHGAADDPEVVARLRTAVRLIGAAKAAAGARLLMVGETIVPKFHDIDLTPEERALLKLRWQIAFVGVALDDLIRRARDFPADAVRRETESYVKRFARVDIPPEAVDKEVRVLLATRDIAREQGAAALAFRCWPEMAARFGAWPCTTLSVLNELGLPAACEGDPAGALDMLLAAHLTKTPSTLLDIVDWDDRAQTFSIWHCGPTAPCWADQEGGRLLPHNVDGATPEGRPNFGAPGIVDMTFAPGPVTVYRTLGAMDDEFAVEGALIPAADRKIGGSFGLVSQPRAYGRPTEVRTLRNAILDRCLPHHFAAVRGHLFT